MESNKGFFRGSNWFFASEFGDSEKNHHDVFPKADWIHWSGVAKKKHIFSLGTCWESALDFEANIYPIWCENVIRQQF